MNENKFFRILLLYIILFFAIQSKLSSYELYLQDIAKSDTIDIVDINMLKKQLECVDTLWRPLADIGRDFIDCEIFAEPNPFKTLFIKELDLSSIVFSNSVRLFETSYIFKFNMMSILFKDACTFDNSSFPNNTVFENLNFNKLVTFDGNDFSENVSFTNTNFNDVSFDNTFFSEYLNLFGTNFNSKTSFVNTVLPDSIDFRCVNIKGDIIDFTTTIRGKDNHKCKIALARTNINKIRINMDLFELWFPPYFKTKTLYGLEMRDVITEEEVRVVYEQLLANFKTNGFVNSYKALDIQYDKYQAKHKGWFSFYVLDTIQDLWWEYGYSKNRIFLWTFLIFIMFSIINMFFIRKLISDIYRIKFMYCFLEEGKNKFIRKISFLNSVGSYTAIVFFGLKMDVEKFQVGAHRKHPFLFIYLMLIYIIGLICLGFIVNVLFK